MNNRTKTALMGAIIPLGEKAHKRIIKSLFIHLLNMGDMNALTINMCLLHCQYVMDSQGSAASYKSLIFSHR